jgi:CheY-like chemotaxis protein
MLEGIHILMVDDDQDQTEMYAFALGRFGAEVEGATTVDEALAAFGARPFDVVVCDLMLHEHDGYELARELRSSGVEVPAIALTGLATPACRERALAAGFDEFCTKPCPPSKLASVIARLIGTAVPISTFDEWPADGR